MRGLWLEGQKLYFRENLPLPVPSAGAALIRVRLAGICGTDVELVRGYYPYAGIPGHEFVGEVAASENPSLMGRRVVGEINVSCGQCQACRRGHPTHCEHRSVLGIRGRNGAFAEFICLPEANLHSVADEVSDEQAVFAEPLAAALQIQEQVSIGPGDGVLLVGAGRLGQLIARSLCLTGCNLQVVARHEAQKRALESHSIETISEADVQHRRFDVVVEATGGASGFALALAAVRPGGTLVLKSTYRGELKLDPATLVVNEIRLLGSRCGPFPKALEQLAKGAIDPTDLIDAVLPLPEGLEAFSRAERPGTMKVLLKL